MKQKMMLLLATVGLAGCYQRPNEVHDVITSFRVKVDGIYLPGTRTPLGVVSTCSSRFPEGVPDSERGTPGCRYAIPRGDVDLEVSATAVGPNGEDVTDFSGPVAFRVVPGDLAKNYGVRWSQATDGKVKATLKVSHLYGEVRVWVEDAPPQLMFQDGGLITEGLPPEPDKRSFATGLSEIRYFEEPTLAKLQVPDSFDNRLSPFVGQFLTIGRKPESGEVTRQTCQDLGPDGKPQAVNGEPAMLVITGADSSGFFVTDLTACRMKEQLTEGSVTQVRTAEPDGYLPGSFGSMYIYNYSFPEGLDSGDLLWTLSGSVQEFTGTTQLTFPAWSIREKVRTRPPAEWDIYLRQVKPKELNLRICGIEDKLEPFITDSLCGYSNTNLKIESLESALIKLRNVRFPEVFKSCDFNWDFEVPFFCNGRAQDGTRSWQDCNTQSDIPEPFEEERQCNIACVIGQGEFAGKRCAERSTYDFFGQFTVEMAGPGPAWANLDDSLPSRMIPIALPASPGTGAAPETVTALPFAAGVQVRVACQAEIKVQFGNASAKATDTGTSVAKGQVFEHTLAAGETHLAVWVAERVPAGTQCFVSENGRTRINLITRDAIPDLKPDCNPDDADAEKAEQCRFLRAARYDVVGHLRQVQPGRPRWNVFPRDADDVCCYPGAGLQCPKPLKPCP